MLGSRSGIKRVNYQGPKFGAFADIPMSWLFAWAVVNPHVIAEYVFPGTITGFYAHLEDIQLAPEAEGEAKHEGALRDERGMQP